MDVTGEETASTGALGAALNSEDRKLTLTAGTFANFPHTGTLVIDSERIGDYSHTSSFRKLNDELERTWAALGRRFPIDFV